MKFSDQTKAQILAVMVGILMFLSGNISGRFGLVVQSILLLAILFTMYLMWTANFTEEKKQHQSDALEIFPREEVEATRYVNIQLRWTKAIYIFLGVLGVAMGIMIAQ